jgi:hypothetical protein
LHPRSIIFESDPIRRAALYYFLRRLGVATEVRIALKVAAEASIIEHSSNSPADWAERGMLLTQQQQWEGAAHCFSQVGCRRCVVWLLRLQHECVL